MTDYGIDQQTLRKKVKQNLDWFILILRKSQGNAFKVTRQNMYTLNLQMLMHNELKMVGSELKPYLILPPDGPSCE
jgi:hypothetical protein